MRPFSTYMLEDLSENKPVFPPDLWGTPFLLVAPSDKPPPTLFSQRNRGVESYTRKCILACLGFVFWLCSKIRNKKSQETKKS